MFSSSLTSLSLKNNPLRDEGVEALSIGLKESKSLKTLDLSNPSILERFGPKGAAALATAVSAMGSLTKLDVRYTSLDEATKDALKVAASGKDGFELLI